MFVKVANEQVEKFPYTVGDLKRDNPNTSFPKNIPDDMLLSYGVVRVKTETQPEVNEHTHKVVQDQLPVYINGGWIISWSVVERNEDEKLAYKNAEESKVRSKRNKLLAETDWVVVKYSETNSVVPAEWATYRQALRDITNHTNFPYLNADDWPVKPE